MVFWLVLTASVYLAGFLSALHAVMHGRTSQGTIAWATGLVFVPIVAVPMYWVLGSSRFHGYVTARYTKERKVYEAFKRFMEELDPYAVRHARAAAQAAEKLADLPFLRGNAVELLVDGEAMFSSLLAGIDAAESCILFQFYIVHDDDIGRKVKAHLIAKAGAGVRVRFLYDEIGSLGLPAAYLDELRDAGIEVHPFHTRKGPGNRFQLNFRNHRKVMVVDGKAAWIGGINVGDEYLGRDPKAGHWRDTHMKITGPAALGVQLSFVEDWFWATDRLGMDLNWKPEPSRDADVPVLIVPTGPADPLETAGLMFHHAVNSARRRLWIASPYFVPDDAVVSALQLAALRGVDVRILIPDRSDNRLVEWSAYTFFDQLHRVGVRFYRYRDGFLHEKVTLIDEETVMLGTANFDNRSFRLNFEITGIVADAAFASETQSMFEADFARSRRMRAEDIEGRSFLFRLVTRLARLAAPVQ